MSAILSNEGRTALLQKIITDEGPGWVFGFFKNNIAVSASTVFATLVESTFPGYARQTPAFPAPSLNGVNQAVSTAPTLTYTHTGGGSAESAYGYFLLHTPTGKLKFIELFPVPKLMSTLGDAIALTPTLYLDGLTVP